MKVFSWWLWETSQYEGGHFRDDTPPSRIVGRGRDWPALGSSEQSYVSILVAELLVERLFFFFNQI